VFAGFLESGRAISGLDYGRSAIERRNLRGAMQKLFTDIDIMVVSIMPWLNPSVAEFNALCESAEGRQKLVHFTCIYDTTGQPSLTLPAGLDANGSPIGSRSLPGISRRLCSAVLAWPGSALAVCTTTYLRWQSDAALTPVGLRGASRRRLSTSDLAPHSPEARSLPRIRSVWRNEIQKTLEPCSSCPPGCRNIRRLRHRSLPQ
jgi:hypothetical protein